MANLKIINNTFLIVIFILIIILFAHHRCECLYFSFIFACTAQKYIPTNQQFVYSFVLQGKIHPTYCISNVSSWVARNFQTWIEACYGNEIFQRSLSNQIYVRYLNGYFMQSSRKFHKLKDLFQSHLKIGLVIVVPF